MHLFQVLCYAFMAMIIGCIHNVKAYPRATSAPTTASAIASPACTPFALVPITSTVASSELQQGYLNFPNGTSCQQTDTTSDEVLCCPNYYGIYNASFPNIYVDPIYTTNLTGECVYYGDGGSKNTFVGMESVPCNDDNENNPANANVGIQSSPNTTTIVVGYCATVVENATPSIFVIQTTASQYLLATKVHNHVEITNGILVTALTGGSTTTYSTTQFSPPSFCSSSSAIPAATFDNYNSNTSSTSGGNSSSRNAVSSLSIPLSFIVIVFIAFIFGTAIIQ